MDKQKFTRCSRNDWNKFEGAAHTIAKAFGVTVECSQKYDYLRTIFNSIGVAQLKPEQNQALNKIEYLIELVSEFPSGYLRTLEIPKK